MEFVNRTFPPLSQRKIPRNDKLCSRATCEETRQKPSGTTTTSVAVVRPRFISFAFLRLLLCKRSTYVSGHECTCTIVEKRNGHGYCIGAAIATPDYTQRTPVSFDVKHVRHEEYVNNANKTLFIARAVPGLFYHCFLCNLFIPFISRISFFFFIFFLRALKRDVSLVFSFPGSTTLSPRLDRDRIKSGGDI